MIKISVIIPIYYGKSYIPRLIKMMEDNASKSGDYFSLELIFVNDSLSDGSIQGLFCSDVVSIKIVEHESNQGIHRSRVDGLLCSDADYICFLDQDDWISSNHFRSQLDKIGDSDFVICNGKNRSDTIYESRRDFDIKVSKDIMLKGINYIVSTGQVLIRRESIPQIWINSILKKNGADDYYLWILLMLEGKTFSYNSDILYGHVFTDENTSCDGRKMNESVIEMTEFLYRNGYIDKDTKNVLINTRKETCIKNIEERYRKKSKEADIMFLWKKNELKGFYLKDYFMTRNINCVSVYGMGNLGKILVKELVVSEIRVNAIIDRRELLPINDIPLIKPEEDSEFVENSDLIIVTVLNDFKEIRSLLEKKYGIEVISLEGILSNLDMSLDE